MKKKIYCNNCKYCGNIINYYPYNPYPVTEEPHRFCNNPDIKLKSIKRDTFYQHIEFNPIVVCNEINKNNDCKWFEKVKN
ncbi:MAG: hypothetical protein IMZ52_04715 [Actinobacteria bacterium]|nr:hypothetical protein [Actinomycetota bacterium]MBE3114767.1 hypothetical protein [Actinomycetota bacterium]